MQEEYIPLNSVPIGNKVLIKSLKSTGSTRRRMLDLGLVSNTIVEAVQRSPSGDPVAYSFRGAVIALRSEETRDILVETL